MQEKKNENRQLADILECRFLNVDAAGLVLERLPQHELLRLYRWFTHEEGGMSGALLIDTAPILDTLIEIQAYLPPFMTVCLPENESGQEPSSDEVAATEEEVEGSTLESDCEGLHIEELMDGLDPNAAGAPGIRPSAGSNPRMPGASRNDTSGTSPQAVAYGFFGCGLMWGAGYLENARDCDESPFPLKGNISDFMDHVSQEGADHLGAEKSEKEATRIMSPVWLTQSLAALCPPLDIVLHSAFKLSRRSKEGAWEDNDDGSHLRFLFFLGLLAAGLRVPALSSRRGFAR